MTDRAGGRVHVVGAGLAGLAAALSLTAAGRPVTLWEQAGHAGGRCRSWHDPQIGRVIDNGNHLLLSANSAALAYLEECGGLGGLREGLSARFAFHDLRTGQDWRLDLGDARFPTWLFRASGRVPGSGLVDYLALWRLLWPRPGAVVGDALERGQRLYRPLVQPLTLAVMNADPDEACAKTFAAVLRATLLRGGAACRPLLTREGLGPCFVEPAAALLKKRGASLHFHARLRSLAENAGRVSALGFGEQQVPVNPGEAVVLALPPDAASQLLPGLSVPLESRAIVNLHYRLDPPPAARLPEVLGVLGGSAQWIFTRGDVASVTISAADDLAGEDADSLAARVWPEVAAALGLPKGETPSCRVVKEKRATFAQTPANEALRPGSGSALSGLYLAGDWTDTGLPATLEGAIRSGRRAAGQILGLGAGD